jgi:hypothetical protein
VHVSVQKQGQDGIIVNVPLLMPEHVKGDDFLHLLLSKANQYNPQVEVEILQGKKVVDRDAMGADNDRLARLIQQYQVFGSPEHVKERLDNLNRVATNAQEEVARLHDRIVQLERECRNPEDLSLLDLSVLTARQLAGTQYAVCADQYAEAFPGGLDEKEIRDALEKTKKQYIFDEETLKLCIEDAGVDPNQPLDELLAEAQERTQPFTRSQYYDAELETRLGAAVIVRKKSEFGPERVRRAEEHLREYEQAETSWEEARGANAKLLAAIAERSELYEIALGVVSDHRAGLSVPVVAFTENHEEGQRLYLVLPTTAENENASLTVELRKQLGHALGQVLKKHEVPIRQKEGVTLEQAQGNNKVICVHMLPGKTSMDTVLGNLPKEYENHALSKVGVKIQLYNLGGYHAR